MSSTKLFLYPIIGIIALLGLITLNSAVYAIGEAEYGLVLRFGEVRAEHLEPGLKVKAPFIDSLQRIDKRTLRADIPPRDIPDQDKERLIIDVILRYRITDPLQFRKTLRDEQSALDRLQQITYSALRTAIANADRTEVIGAQPVLDADCQPVSGPDGLPIHESLADSRDAIDAEIYQRINTEINRQNYGIELLSVDIKQADFPASTRGAIVARLTEERNRVAQSHRAAGEERYLEETAAVDAEAAIIRAEARQTARRLRGEADAAAIRIVREALTANPEFYRFQRTLESYRQTLQPGAVVIAAADPNNYFGQLLQPPEAITAMTAQPAAAAAAAASATPGSRPEPPAGSAAATPAAEPAQDEPAAAAAVTSQGAGPNTAGPTPAADPAETSATAEAKMRQRQPHNLPPQPDNKPTPQ